MFRGGLLLLPYLYLVDHSVSRRAAAAPLLGLSCVPFGLIHLSAGGWPNVLTAAAQGLVWGLITLRTRSLVPSMAAHAAYDTGIFVST